MFGRKFERKTSRRSSSKYGSNCFYEISTTSISDIPKRPFEDLVPLTKATLSVSNTAILTEMQTKTTQWMDVYITELVHPRKRSKTDKAMEEETNSILL
jgi:hypothetical protein